MAGIKSQPSLHFTSDLWKCKLTGFQYISLTIHWCEVKTFQMRHFCLGTVRVDGHAVNEKCVKWSPPIQDELYAIQTDLGLPHLKVQQHTPIRWDSKFTMMNRCQTLKPALLELYTDSEYLGTAISGSD